MEHFVMDLVLPAASAVLFISALLLGFICSLAKVAPESLVGVQALPTPFASRKEYLTAALEMDLDEFLKRAHVTPTHIKYSKCPEPNAAREKLAKIQERLKRAYPGWYLAERQDTSKQEPDEYLGMVVRDGVLKLGPGGNTNPDVGPGSCPVGAQGVSGLVGIPGAAAGPGGAGCVSPDTRIVGIPGMDDRSFQGVRTLDGLTRKQGCWYRSKYFGLLRFVRAFSDHVGTFVAKGAWPGLPVFEHLYWSEIELALPRIGETWKYELCSQHFPAASGYPFVVESDCPLLLKGGHLVREWVLCGCLVPFEFGKGKIQA